MESLASINIGSNQWLEIIQLSENIAEFRHATSGELILINKRYPIRIKVTEQVVVIWTADQVYLLKGGKFHAIEEEDFIGDIFVENQIVLVGDTYIKCLDMSNFRELSQHHHGEIILDSAMISEESLEFSDLNRCRYRLNLLDGSIVQVNPN